jgi:LmbE family N-acetylglucosaminyl deacetylase
MSDHDLQSIRTLVVSPHCDDAVFGCADLIAASREAVVVTVFAGRPEPSGELTDWDARCGFTAGDDVMGARREEDRRALELLGAEPVWLDYCDSQYRRPPSVDEVAATLRETIAAKAPDVIAIPLGLFHSDHRLAADAALSLLGMPRHASWVAYEDALYRRIPRLLNDRLTSLTWMGLSVSRARVPCSADGDKRRAVACYGSQLQALASDGRPGTADIFAEEGYWHLRRGTRSPFLDDLV